jgi:nucleoside 2-deoxyribosyltransferase
MRLLYLAGPYSAPSAWLIEHNVRQAEAVALQVWARGYVALCPHTMTRFYHGALPEAVWLAGDLEMLSRCDGVLLLKGWEQSRGAQAERDFALRVGIPVFLTLLDVETRWRNDRAEEAGNVPASSQHGVG